MLALRLSVVAAVLPHLLGSAGALQPAARRLQEPSEAPEPAPAPGHHIEGGTNEACCARLTAIGFRTELPVVIVDTRGHNVTRNDTRSDLCTCSHGLKKGDSDLKVDFRIRGGTNSQMRNKVFQYAVDLSTKKPFLGMPKSKKWMLYAQQLDPFGLHTWLGFNLTRSTGEYAARTQFCELFLIDDSQPLNTNRHYRGIYVAMEKVRQESNRVNISDNTDPKDLSGGYMLEFKHSQNPENLRTVNGSVTDKQWNIEYPKPENITEAQVEYLQQYLDEFEDALYGPNSTDPASGWRKYANETAFTDWFLASELVRNVKHTYHSSAWLTKDAGKKFHMGPVWDNVQGFGTCCGYPVQGFESGGKSPINPASGGNGVSSSGWLFTVCLNGNCPALDKYAPGYGISTWFQQLWKDPEWVKGCAARYQELRAGPWNDDKVAANLASLKPLLRTAANRTLTRWAAELGQPQYFQTNDAQFEYVVSQLARWTLNRLSWLDHAFKQALDPAAAEGPWPAVYPGMPPAEQPGPNVPGLAPGGAAPLGSTISAAASDDALAPAQGPAVRMDND